MFCSKRPELWLFRLSIWISDFKDVCIWFICYLYQHTTLYIRLQNKILVKDKWWVEGGFVGPRLISPSWTSLLSKGKYIPFYLRQQITTLNSQPLLNPLLSLLSLTFTFETRIYYLTSLVEKRKITFLKSGLTYGWNLSELFVRNIQLKFRPI